MKFELPAALDLAALAQGTAHLSPAVCSNLVEAAVVCLSWQDHSPGTALVVEDATVPLTWGPLDPRALRSRSDTQEATEQGATAVAIALIREGTAFDVVERSWKGTGFDYFLAQDDPAGPFQHAACLEVSGIRNEDDAEMRARLAAKVAQVKRGACGLPGYAVVVGFRTPRAAVRSVP